MKKAVWFSDSDIDIINFIGNIKGSFSGNIKILIRYAIELKKRQISIDADGNLCVLSKIDMKSNVTPDDEIKHTIDVSGLV